MMITLADEMTRVSQQEGLLREQADVKRDAADPIPHPAVIEDEPHLGVPPALPQSLPESSGKLHEQKVRRNNGHRGVLWPFPPPPKPE